MSAKRLVIALCILVPLAALVAFAKYVANWFDADADFVDEDNLSTPRNRTRLAPLP